MDVLQLTHDHSPTDTDALSGALHHEVVPTTGILNRLLAQMVILPEEWEELSVREREELASLRAEPLLLERLVHHHVLTPFQADWVQRGQADELILDRYRLLDVLGKGGMGTVYRAEHIHLRRRVAIKVMTRSVGENPRFLQRFCAEARAVARIQHPNIVTCLDAGRVNGTAATGFGRDYFVMELIPGQDLLGLVRDQGPLSPRRACDLFRQVADALGEAHRLGLIHRDIKPSNILVNPDWQAKVLDFGLARQQTQQMTEPGTLLGTIGYMAPEQTRDPSAVDARADLFSLGATMYWALTGKEPYPESGNLVRDLRQRMTASPLPVRQLRPEVPQELSELVERLMRNDPEQRYRSARTVAAALNGFLPWLAANDAHGTDRNRPLERNRILLVDDDPVIRKLMAACLGDRYEVREAENADEALAEVTRHLPHLAVIDVNLPGASGSDLLDRIRSAIPNPERVQVLLISGELPDVVLGGLAVSGADDFLAKPFRPSEFQSRVESLLLRRSIGADGNGAALKGTVRIPHGATVRTPPAPPPVRPLVTAEALSFTVSQVLIDLGLLTAGHWGRISRYVRALAGAVRADGEYARLRNDAYLDQLAAFAPTYDIGLLGIPRAVLMKPDRLDATETNVVQTHTTQGADLLLAVAGRFAREVPGLPLASEVARSHHERWDGTGYPDALAGPEIPLSARVVAIASVYEALRARRPHRPPLGHKQAVKTLATESPGQFDPALLLAFSAVAVQFETIYRDEAAHLPGARSVEPFDTAL